MAYLLELLLTHLQTARPGHGRARCLEAAKRIGNKTSKVKRRRAVQPVTPQHFLPVSLPAPQAALQTDADNGLKAAGRRRLIALPARLGLMQRTTSGDQPMSQTPAAIVQIPDSVTVCITSCGRLDLLAQTLASFRAFNAGGTYIVSEDSTDPAIISELQKRYREMQVLSGAQRLGLMGSIDRLYSAVDTPFIFHLEDDWEFDGPIDWPAAIAMLETNPKVANVCLRAFDEIKPKYRARSDRVSCAGATFQVMRANAHPEFFGWSSNPGLISTSLYKSYQPFGRMLHDQMSGAIKKDGRTIAYMLPGVARHIGRGRNVADPMMPARPKSRPKKWLRMIKKQLYYAGLRKEPF